VVILALAAAMVYTSRRGIAVIGAVGHLARAVALAVVGLLIARAAVFVDARRVGGLDAALRVGETGSGSVLLVVVAQGLAVFGIFLAWPTRWPAAHDR
jgi:hypothetical protein